MAVPPHTNFRYGSNSREREGLLFNFNRKVCKVKIRKDRKLCSIPLLLRILFGFSIL